MSRIGKHPVPVPNGVTVTIDGNAITVKGPKGELSRTLHPEMQVALENGDRSRSTRPSDEAQHKALHGLTRTLVANMVEGVTKGYKKQLEIIGVGYKAEVKPYGLQLALGFSHPIEYQAPAGIKLTAPQPTQVVVEGADKEMVGQVAAEIRSCASPSRTRARASSTQGEQVRRKAGKAGGK